MTKRCNAAWDKVLARVELLNKATYAQYLYKLGDMHKK